MYFRKSFVRPFKAVYEGDGTPAGAGAGGASGGGSGTPAAGEGAGTGKSFSQDEVNNILKKEKDSYRQRMSKLETDLQTIQGSAKTSEETRQMLESQLEELRTANMTTSERAEMDKKKLEKQHAAAITDTENRAKTWQDRYTQLHINGDVMSSAIQSGVAPDRLPFVQSYFNENRIRLVEGLDEETNKPNGKFVAKVKLTVTGEKGVLKELDLTVPEALAAMREDVGRYGFLFESGAAGGLGAQSKPAARAKSGTPLTTEEYMKQRKKDRRSVLS